MKMRVKIEDKIYEVSLGDLHSRPISASVEGQQFEVWPAQADSSGAIPSDTLSKPTETGSIPQAGKFAGQTAGNGKTVTAPLPGVIIDVCVSAGDSITFGQDLCVLEAMKMKNTIRSNREGRLKAVHVQSGDQVQHGALLVEFED